MKKIWGNHSPCVPYGLTITDNNYFFQIYRCQWFGPLHSQFPCAVCIGKYTLVEEFELLSLFLSHFSIVFMFMLPKVTILLSLHFITSIQFDSLFALHILNSKIIERVMFFSDIWKKNTERNIPLKITSNSFFVIFMFFIPLFAMQKTV